MKVYQDDIGRTASPTENSNNRAEAKTLTPSGSAERILRRRLGPLTPHDPNKIRTTTTSRGVGMAPASSRRKTYNNPSKLDSSNHAALLKDKRSRRVQQRTATSDGAAKHGASSETKASATGDGPINEKGESTMVQSNRVRTGSKKSTKRTTGKNVSADSSASSVLASRPDFVNRRPPPSATSKSTSFSSSTSTSSSILQKSSTTKDALRRPPVRVRSQPGSSVSWSDYGENAPPHPDSAERGDRERPGTSLPQNFEANGVDEGNENETMPSEGRINAEAGFTLSLHSHLADEADGPIAKSTGDHAHKPLPTANENDVPLALSPQQSEIVSRRGSTGKRGSRPTMKSLLKSSPPFQHNVHVADPARAAAGRFALEFSPPRKGIVRGDAAIVSPKLPSSSKPSGSGGVLMDMSNLFSPGSGVESTPAPSSGTLGCRADEDALPPPPVLTLGNFQESAWIDFGNDRRNIVGKTRCLPFLLHAPEPDPSEQRNDPNLSQDDMSYHLEVERVPSKKGIHVVDNEGRESSLQSKPVGFDRRNAASASSDGQLDASVSCIRVKTGETRRLFVSWTPNVAGGIREVVHLKLPRGRFRITVQGSARSITPKKKKNPKRSRSEPKHGDEPFVSSTSKDPSAPLRPADRPQVVDHSNYETPIPGASDKVTSHKQLSKRQMTHSRRSSGAFSLAKSNSIRKMSVIKTPSNRLLKSSPGTSANATSLSTSSGFLFDEQWADKQCDSFTKWMNYAFHPTEDFAHESDLQELQDGDGTSDSAIATMDRSALRSLLLHRRRAQARRRARELFTSDSMKSLRHAIEGAVEKGVFSVRSDRDMYADLGLRQQVLNLLLSYCTPWLHLGLETVFGEIIPTDRLPQSLYSGKPPEDQKKLGTKGESKEKLTKNSKKAMSRTKLILKHFIVDRVLGDPATLMKYTGGKCRVPSGVFARRYHADLGKNTLRRIFLLVAILDRCKHENVLDKVPRLFTKDGEVKSSKDILTTICRDFLSGEGNIIKHLSLFGLNVSYKQNLIDDFDFTASNLAVDLRDGVRLGRLSEILTKDTELSISARLRLPAVSRLQKLHNVGIALAKLREDSVPNIEHITSKHVVDGHREHVLTLLWSIISQYQIAALLDANVLRDEINRVQRANSSWRSKASFLSRERTESVCMEHSPKYQDQITSLLLRWCQAVCACFGLHVHNFTTSFADGKVLCFLLHYYHPSILTRAEVLPTTRDLPMATENLDAKMNHGLRHWGDMEFGPETTREQYREALSNERCNSILVNKRMAELGGVPGMLPISDSINVPEEKSMIVCTAYLCARLMECSKEILATLRVQACYRRYRSRIAAKQRQRAAMAVVDCWQRYLDKDRIQRTAFVLLRAAQRRLTQEDLDRRERGASSIQRIWRQRATSERLRSAHAKATCIQRFWRGLRERMVFAMTLASVVLLQSSLRRMEASGKYYTARNGFVLLQGRVRGALVRDTLHDMAFFASEIQRTWKGYRAQLEFAVAMRCIIQIQSVARMHAARWIYNAKANAATLIQLQFRSWLMVLAETEADAATIIQSNWRWYLFTCTKQRENCAAILIQTWWRVTIARSLYMEVAAFVVRIQVAVRRTAAMTRYSKGRNGVLILQAIVRGALVRDNMEVSHFAATEIERISRGHFIQKKFRLAIESTTKVQAHIRGHVTRVLFLSQKRSAKIIQTQFRTWKMQAAEREILSAILLQRVCRRRSVVRSKMRETHSAVLIQTRFRGLSARLKFCDAVRSSVLIQTTTRCMLAMTMFQRRRDVALVLQRIFRGSVVRAEVRSKHAAAISIQHILRGSFDCSAYKNTLASAIVIQSAVRYTRASTRFSTARNGTIHLQAVFRRTSVRRNLELAHLRASEIQSLWRKHVAQRNFLLVKKSIIRMQTRHRTHRDENMYQKQIWAVKRIQCRLRTWKMQAEEQEIKSIILVQSFCRRHVVFLQNCRNYDAAVLLQARVRAYFSMCTYSDAVGCIVLLQARCRCSMASNAFSTKIKSLVLIQRIHRASVVRGYIHSQRNSSILIQRAWRGACTRGAYIATDLCATVVQAAVRQSICLVRYGKARRGIVGLQAITRGMLARVNVELELFAASELQRIGRKFLARKRFMLSLQSAVQVQKQIRVLLALRSYRKQRVSIKRIQRRYRAWMLQVAQNEIKSITVLQSMLRRHMVTRCIAQKNSAAATIQAHYRGITTRRNWDDMSSSAVILQSVARGLLASKCYHDQKNAATQIQSTYQWWKFKVRKEEIAAITVLQSTWRCHVASKQMVRRKGSVVIMQAMARGIFQRQHDQLQARAVIGVQRIWRGWKTQVEFLMLVAASTMLQAERRRISDQRVYSQTRRKVIKLQAFVRATFGIKVLRGQRYAAIKIQKIWRGVHLCGEYTSVLCSSIKIQSVVRRMIDQCSYERVLVGVSALQGIIRGAQSRESLILQHFAANEMQRVWRGQSQKVMYVNKLSSAVAMQRYWRGIVAYWTFNCQREATMTLQRMARGMLARMDLEMKRFAASEVQRIFRGYRAEVNYVAVVLAAIQIQAPLRGAKVRRVFEVYCQSAIKAQSFVRGSLARKASSSLRYGFLLSEAERLACNNSAKKIQHVVRSHLYRRKIIWHTLKVQSLFRAFSARMRARTMKSLIVWLQSTFRGQMTRSLRCKRVRLAAMKIQRANTRALRQPELKLGHRTKAALHTLQTSKRLSELMRAIITLEVSTRLSKVCCIAFAGAKAPHVLYTLIRTCNRSLPHLELLHFVLETLINVAKHPSLIQSVATDASIEILIDLLQMFRDKEVIFCLATSLIHMVCSSGDKFKAQCATEENMKRLRGVYSLCLRKAALTKTTSSRKSLGSQITTKHSSNKNYSLMVGIKNLKGILSMTTGRI